MKIKYFTLLCVFFSASVYSQKLTPTDAGSKVHFVIKNFGIKTGGQLSGLKGEILFSPADLSACKFNVTVDPSTIDTDNESRDRHLKGEEYFEVEKYPTITIISAKIDKTNKTESGYYFFTGSIIMHGVTKPVTFPFHVDISSDGYLFTGDFEINRLDFGVGDNSAVLSDMVNVSLSILAKKEN
jgi:polyisoprenoid-binding protein YceI